MSVHDVASYCRICAASCGIIAAVEGDRVISVRGDDAHPGSAGYTCAKGRSLPMLHHHPARLDGPRLNGSDSDWDSTIDDLASRLTAIIDADGADGVGAYLGTGLAYDTAGFVAATAWLRAIGSRRLFTPATVDNAPVLRAAELIAGHPQANPICDFDRAHVVVIFGSNPVVSHGYGTAVANPIVALRKVLSNGGSVWVADPLRTETAAIASRHLQIKPGSDALILAWLVREALDCVTGTDALATTTHLDRNTLRVAVEPFTLERAAEASDVPIDRLLALRDAIVAGRGTVAIWCGTGVTMSRDGLLAEILRWVLLILCDSLDTQDGMRFHRGNAFALRRLHPTNMSNATPRGPKSRPELPALFGQHPCVALNDEIETGNLRALVVAGANPITAFPDPARTTAALQRLEAFGVVDVLTNELTAIASHVFAGASQLERSDIPMHELVMARGATCHTPPVVAKAPNRRATWWIFAQLAHRMTGAHLFGSDADTLADDDVLALFTARAPIGFAEITKAATHGIEIPTGPGWVRNVLLADKSWNIATLPLIERLAELHTRQTSQPSGFVMIPRRRMHANNSVNDPREHDEPLALMHPEDAQSLGIDNDTIARVANARGVLDLKVRHDPRLRRGVISISHGDTQHSPGTLTSADDNIDPETGMPIASGIAVVVTSCG